MATGILCQEEGHEGPSRVHGCKDGSTITYCDDCKRPKCIATSGVIGKPCKSCRAKQPGATNRLAPVRER